MNENKSHKIRTEPRFIIQYANMKLPQDWGAFAKFITNRDNTTLISCPLCVAS